MEGKQTTEPTTCEMQVGLQLAENLMRSGHVAMAIEHYRWVAAACTRRSEYRNALAVYTILADLMPHCLHTHAMVADLHRRLGRPLEAAAIFERIAHAHVGLGRWDDAMAVYKLVVEIDPATVPRRVQLAELLSAQGRRAEAVCEFNVAARQLFAGARTGEYLWVAERLLAHAPDHIATLRDVVRVYLHAGDQAKAVSHLHRLLELKPNDDVGREIMAEVFASRGQYDRACKAAALLGAELRGRGIHAYDEAKRLYRRAVAWYPHDTVAQKQLRELEGEMAQLAKKDFADERTTGVIGFVSDEELLKRPTLDEAVTNVLQMHQHRMADPSTARKQRSEKPAPVIYAKFG